MVKEPKKKQEAVQNQQQGPRKAGSAPDVRRFLGPAVAIFTILGGLVTILAVLVGGFVWLDDRHPNHTDIAKIEQRLDEKVSKIDLRLIVVEIRTLQQRLRKTEDETAKERITVLNIRRQALIVKLESGNIR